MTKRQLGSAAGAGIGAVALALGLVVAAPASAHPGHTPPDPAAGAPPADEGFQKVTLNDTPGEPIDLAVLPDGRVLHTTRSGDIWMNDPVKGINTRAGSIEVYQHDEEGLQSIAVDPGFGTKNRWVYLYYSPPQDTPVDDPLTPLVNEGDAPVTGTPADFAPFEGVIQLSRFKLVRDSIDTSTEEKILQVPVDRGICCHVGGDIVFDANGNLYLSTGDDSNPFESDGFVPIDERADRNPAFDAQRSAANTNDLRGKVLRVKPRAGGGYTVPKGNLFTPGTAGTRPEIYLMGLRNPFRIELDRESSRLFVADYSPDASAADPDRGPSGHGKWFSATEPGNYGWPYCATAELPYVDYDFATSTSGEEFDCAAPVNDSPHNTGLTRLPPVEQPQIWYTYGASSEFPELGTGGIGPMAGPAYHYDPKASRGKTPVAWPEYYDDKAMFYEWTRDWVKGLTLDEDNHLTAIEDVVASLVTDNPMDMEFGPNGALYVLEYGDGYFAENPDAQLSRIDFVGVGGNRSPVPKITADPVIGPSPLTVRFSSAGTTDPEGDRLKYAWDFDSDGRIDSRAKNPIWVYEEGGEYRANLKVTDEGGRNRGRFANADVRVVVGNEVPVVSFVTPVTGQTFSFGDAVPFEVTVTDDQPVDCSKVTVTYVLGHDEHGHPQTTASGCSGTITTTLPGGHDPGEDELRGVFVANYTDDGGDAGVPLTGTAEVVLEPTS